MAGLLDAPSDSKVLEYIKNKENFIVEGRKQKESVKQLESLLENAGYTVRVKTKGREATMLFIPLLAYNITVQAAHTLATYNPDWVIYKNAFGSKIEVKYFGDA